MKIGDFFQNKGVYIIAEVSQNHDGSLGQAHAFIDAVAETGADAIKFQTHIAEEESTPSEPFRINFSYCDKTRYDYWRRMEFTEEQWFGLFQHANEKGLDFLSSPFSEAALHMLDKIGVPAWKFGSGEVFNERLLKMAVSTGKPIILSTGLSTFFDIDKQVQIVRNAGNDILIMQCTTEYPSSPETIALNVIPEYMQRYNCPVGLSDHSATIFPSLAAVTLGARAIEVHVTLSRKMFGPDIKASVTIEELETIVSGTHYIEKMLNNKGDKNVIKSNQKELKRIFSKSIYAKSDIEEGSMIEEKHLAIKKPYCGIDAADYNKVIGLKAKEKICKDTAVEWEMVEK